MSWQKPSPYPINHITLEVSTSSPRMLLSSFARSSNPLFARSCAYAAACFFISASIEPTYRQDLTSQAHTQYVESSYYQYTFCLFENQKLCCQLFVRHCRREFCILRFFIHARLLHEILNHVGNFYAYYTSHFITSRACCNIH